jgi:hypothetical protein
MDEITRVDVEECTGHGWPNEDAETRSKAYNDLRTAGLCRNRENEPVPNPMGIANANTPRVRAHVHTILLQCATMSLSPAHLYFPTTLGCDQ